MEKLLQKLIKDDELDDEEEEEENEDSEKTTDNGRSSKTLSAVATLRLMTDITQRLAKFSYDPMSVFQVVVRPA